MEITPQIFLAKVMHNRIFPKANKFTYGVYYLALPLSNVKSVSYNKPGFVSFYDKDHGAKDGSDLRSWAEAILKKYGLSDVIDEIILLSMPRVLLYTFNPVSFWLCLDRQGALRSVICEVNNTFGETHSYLCVGAQKKVITSDDWLEAKKLFYVSPFLERNGFYKFRFNLKQNSLRICINFHDKEGRKQLITALTGILKPLTKENLRQAFWKHPLITMKSIYLIHWQALKLISKGVKYISKPKQLDKKTSKTESL